MKKLTTDPADEQVIIENQTFETKKDYRFLARTFRYAKNAGKKTLVRNCYLRPEALYDQNFVDELNDTAGSKLFKQYKPTHKC